MAKTTTIKATYRMSTKIKNDFFTVEYTEERAVEKDDNIEDERAKLWETVITEIENQVDDIIAVNTKNEG